MQNAPPVNILSGYYDEVKKNVANYFYKNL